MMIDVYTEELEYLKAKLIEKRDFENLPLTEITMESSKTALGIDAVICDLRSNLEELQCTVRRAFEILHGDEPI